MSRRPVAASLLALATLLLLAPPALAEDYGATVTMLDNAFSPSVARVDTGATVEWENEGRSPHTVVAADGSWSSGTIEPGGTFEHTFGEAGIYRYYCSLHGTAKAGMTGIVAVGGVALPGPAGGIGPGHEPVPSGFGPVVRVPQDYPTIQQAVDHAEPGGLVLVAPGVYEESVTVTVPYLTIRGLNRNTTIVDGGFVRANGIQVIDADGVAIENMTARDNLLNGFYWDDVHGYRGSYLTAYDNGDYGLYAYASDYGQFDHSYASGSPDSGFYIGQCDPCHALITDVLAEHNALGFSGTNASGDFAIVNSEWRDNMAGIVPNTLDSERLAPQHDLLIAGNYVHDNDSTTADAKHYQYPTYGMGIILAGVRDDRVIGNLVEDQATYGIAVLPNLDANLWVTSGNVVQDNVVRRSGRADLVLGAPSAGGDRFCGNEASTSQPPAIQALYPCDGFRPFPAGGGSMAPTIAVGTRFLDSLDGVFPHGDWRTQPVPPDQPQMPGDPATAPPDLAIARVAVPETYRIRPVAGITPAPGPEVKETIAVMGLPLATSWWSLTIGLYGYVLPFVLYATWVAVAMWDLIRQESAPLPHRARWMLVVLVVPFLGPLLYFAFGRSPIPRQLRLTLTLGAVAVYAAFLLLGVLLGG
jgi:plastocyanin